MTAVNFGYFVAALPAGFATKKYSYKRTILVGLALYAAGALLFVPAASWRAYSLFLFALFVIGCGLACLETAANPYVAVLGSAESATRRLNFAQAWNPLGSITGILIGRNFIFDGLERETQRCSAVCAAIGLGSCDATMDSCSGANATGAEEAALGGCWVQSGAAGGGAPALQPICSAAEVSSFELAAALAVQRPYLLISLTVAAVGLLVAVTPFPTPPPLAGAGATPTGALLLPTRRRLLRHQGWREGAAAQFVYVGAQIGTWSYLIRYVQLNLPGKAQHYCTCESLFVGTI